VFFDAEWTSKTQQLGGVLVICSISSTYTQERRVCVFSLVLYLLEISAVFVRKLQQTA
jgi:hypothetical protein